MATIELTAGNFEPGRRRRAGPGYLRQGGPRSPGRPDRYLTALPHEDGLGLPPKPSRTR